MVWSSIDVLHEAFKIAHTYTFFLTKSFYGFDTVFALWFSDFPTLVFYMRIMQSENFATNIHAHYRQSETAPLYTRIIREKNFAPDIYENCGVFEICGRLIDVGIFAFVCITFCICGHRLDKVIFIDWSMSKFGWKNVIKFHKFIVKNVIM